jgi:hypothetical protein
MAYTTINKPSEYFNTKLYTGTGSSNSVTGVGFQPDFTWIKVRSEANNHELYDAVRGATKRIFSDLTDAEDTNTAGLTAFGADGFTVNTGGAVNGSSKTYVAWNWLANGAGVSNTDGSIASTVSANDTAGFSIVKYTGTGSAGNVGHGLSTAPKVLINKSISGSNDWFVGHSSIGFTKFLKLNTTSVESTNSGIWNDTAPTTDHFTINSANGNTNSTGVEYITYCFSEVKGFSKFGLYEGNGNADGTFVYTGFKPAFVLYKAKGAVQSWNMHDNKRLGYNPNNAFLFPNLTQAESNITRIDLLSNGFKLRTTDSGQNGSGQGYIYMAFAENPLINSLGNPATAR